VTRKRNQEPTAHHADDNPKSKPAPACRD
jgi:hypothetical protein